MNEDPLTNKTLYKGFEGGAVYTAESNSEFLVVIDESALSDILSEEDLDDLELTKTFRFKTEIERLKYLNKRFG
ncbi:hypothetical protein Q4561_04915 [Alteromonas sp. 1_MG-2023]|uniref:hypothetical protein n=1 Tax=Alteromonas sp. 1_MG-2023 TaxID=3062669 RepID=UPI0026E2A667|nr:hypothetical protein [Alteromonas sp. 1_MG-2023]MDO6566389.1 hypothetical protein [Alteromonas sp. 1_MG-2023]